MFLRLPRSWQAYRHQRKMRRRVYRGARRAIRQEGRKIHMQIHQSAEDYLEAILVLQKQKGAVRSIDIAVYKNYSKPSISRAVSLLRENGYILVDRDGYITLTESGKEIAEKIYERHELIQDWLIRLGVPEEVAAEDACKMEHELSTVTFQKMKEYILNTHS